MSNLVISNHIIDAPMVDIIKQIKEELSNGKLRDIQLKGDEVRVTCPHHKDGMEQRPSCGVYCGDSPDIEYGAFHCFTCGFSGPLQRFVSECFDKPAEFGRSWLLERFGDTFVEREVSLTPIELTKHKTTNTDYLDESLLDSFQSYHPYMTARKLSRNVCEQYKVKYDPHTESIVFPVWDDYGKLYMLTRRSVRDKTFIIDVNKEKPVYLLNFIKNKDIPYTIICESQINALTCLSYGLSAVATFGCSITQKQFESLNKSNIRHYILAFDGDEAGDRGVERFLKNIRKDVFVDIIKMPRGKDVNDLDKDSFIKLLEQAGLDYNTLKEIYEIRNTY